MTRTLNALALAALLIALHAGTPGCLRVEHGIVVELEAAALADGAASRVRVGDGTSLVVDGGEVTILDVALLRCASARTRSVEPWDPFPGPALARAHDHEGTQLTLTGPFEVSLVDAPAVLGAFTPPPGEYCALHVRLGPSTASTHTLSVRGHTATQELRADCSDASAAHLVLPEPLALDRPGTQRLRMSLFEAEPFAAMSSLVDGEGALGAALLRGVTLQGAVALSQPATPTASGTPGL